MQLIEKQGTMLFGFEASSATAKITEQAENQETNLINIPALKIAKEFQGNALMRNMVMLGSLWKSLDLPLEKISQEIRTMYASKPKLMEIDLQCAEAGYNFSDLKILEKSLSPTDKNPAQILLDGNHAVALGGIVGGVKNYFAYPMSPSSSILTHMAKYAKEFGLVVKQCEDEITVANMTLGANYAGTRAFCGTSGGGFDLMTETFSLAGITETPLVITIVQRPGPATGLPTWTGQGDLNLAIHSAHGDFGRMVLAVGDTADAFDKIQEALNFSEQYQIPVILLSEKLNGESITTANKDRFSQKKTIKRNLVSEENLKQLQNSDRYKITDNGISQRWIPGDSEATYCANGDEHKEDGTLTEDAIPASKMYDKRCRKMDTILADLPDAKLYGEPKADISFVGWGSTFCVMQDIIAQCKSQNISVNYLHYSYLYPLKTEEFTKLFANNSNIHLIEGNYNGQLGTMLENKTKLNFAGKFLKYDGRAFYTEEVINYIKNNSK